jgi:hypothetical protein
MHMPVAARLLHGALGLPEVAIQAPRAFFQLRVFGLEFLNFLFQAFFGRKLFAFPVQLRFRGIQNGGFRAAEPGLRAQGLGLLLKFRHPANCSVAPFAQLRRFVPILPEFPPGTRQTARKEGHSGDNDEIARPQGDREGESRAEGQRPEVELPLCEQQPEAREREKGAKAHQ